jgi:hypothetical protein
MEQSERESWLAGEVASSELKRPAGQVVQEEEEDVPEKAPFGHVVHGLVAPIEELNVPAMQAVTSEGLGKWIRHIVVGSRLHVTYPPYPLISP